MLGWENWSHLGPVLYALSVSDREMDEVKQMLKASRESIQNVSETLRCFRYRFKVEIPECIKF